MDIALNMTNAWSGQIGHDRLFLKGPITFSDNVRLTLSGNNENLITNSTTRIAIHYPTTILDHPHALGPNNAMPVLLGAPNSSYGGAMTGLLATDGNHVNASIIAPIPNQGVSSGDAQYVTGNQHPTMLLRVGLADAGEVTFSGKMEVVGAFPQEHQYCLTAPSNGVARFTGTVSGGDVLPMQILGLGDVGLYATNTTMKNGVSIRGGRLLLGSLKDAAGTKPIILGDTVPVVTQANLLANFSPLVSSGTWSTNTSSGTYTFNTSPPQVDGVTPVIGDRILVNDPVNAYRNGLYLMTDVKTWTRTDDLDQESEFVHGLRIKITNGTTYAGKALYLFNYEDKSPLDTKFKLNWTNHRLAFHFESEAEPNVAVLSDGAVTITNDIWVVDNKSAGKSVIGGLTADESTFSGKVILSRAVTLTAVQDGVVTMSGEFSGEGDLIKSGAGTVRLTGSDSATGGYLVEQGTLAFGQPVTLNKPISFEAKEGVTGTITVSGDLTFGEDAGLASLPEGLDPEQVHTLITCIGGTIQGTLAVEDLPLNWHVRQKSTSVITYFAPGGTQIFIK